MSHSLDGSFVRWAERLHNHFLEHHPPPPGLEPIPDDVILPPKWSLEKPLENSTVTNGHTSPPLENAPPSSPLPIPDGWTATLVGNDRLTQQNHWQDVRLISFDIPKRDGVKLE